MSHFKKWSDVQPPLATIESHIFDTFTPMLSSDTKSWRHVIVCPASCHVSYRSDLFEAVNHYIQDWLSQFTIRKSQ
jgi:hypothetical protein